jgi:3-oxoacyl-[acyl-carrier protein] reductase
LADRLALVTGAAGAIGAAVARVLAREGFVVAACDVDGARLADRVAELRRAGGNVFAVEADVGSRTSVAAAFDRVAARAGAPAVLVHAAGTPGRFAYLSELDDADWRAVLATHLDGFFHLLRAAAPAMRAAGSGRIVAIASLAGLRGTVGSGAYAAAKAGMIALVKTAAKEFGPWGVTVNAVAPGMVATPPNLALQARGSGFVAAALAQTPTRAMSDPQDLAQLVAFLASPAAANINGQVIAHDGGAGEVVAGVDAFMRERLEPTVDEPREPPP